VGSQSDGTAEAVVTVNGVSSRSKYVHLRVEPNERKRWQEAAKASGRSLSAMIRDALAAELERRDHGNGDGVAPAFVATQTRSARAEKTLERAEDTVKEVEQLGLWPPGTKTGAD
jgi:hypothetical protein